MHGEIKQVNIQGSFRKMKVGKGGVDRIINAGRASADGRIHTCYEALDKTGKVLYYFENCPVIVKY